MSYAPDNLFSDELQNPNAAKLVDSIHQQYANQMNVIAEENYPIDGLHSNSRISRFVNEYQQLSD